MGHVLGGYNSKPFHLHKLPAVSKEELLDARGMVEPIYDAKTRTRRTLFRQPMTEATALLKSGALANL